MNIRQAIALVIGSGIACLMLAFPPYWNDSGLIGGDEYHFFRNPPPSGYPWSFDAYLLYEQLGMIALITVAALISFRSTAKRSQIISGGIGLAVTYTLMLLMQPWDGMFSGFVWQILGVIATAVLVLVLVLGFAPRRRRSKEKPNPNRWPPMPE